MRADSNIVFLMLFFMFVTIAPLQFCWCRNSTSGLITRELHALLKLKKSLYPSKDADYLLKSWTGNDYCKWEGVGCDGITGHVVKLDLRQNDCKCRDVDSVLEMCDWCQKLAAHEVNPSMLEFKHLSYLDLSGIPFDGPIPEFLSSMKQLRYLNLSYCEFSGKVPHHLASLSNLQVLDVSCDNCYRSLYADNNMGWLSNLTSLKHLAMNGVSLQKAYNLFQVLHMLPFLFQVEFRGCQLTNMHIIPSGPVNSTFLNNVEALNLAHNFLHGPIPDAFRNMTSLRDLNLGGNYLTSVPYWVNNLHSLVHLNLSANPFHKIEASVLSILTNLCSLRSLDLSYTKAVLRVSGLSYGNYSGRRRYDLEELMLRGNGIKDTLPSWIGDLSNLKSLDLAMNFLYGPIPLSFGNLYALTSLDLSRNLLNGTIPTSFDSLSELTNLHLSNNQLQGSIPTNLGRLSSLRELDLSSNLLNGSIPESLGQLGKLMSLRVVDNSLTGVVSETHLRNLSNLRELQIGFNNLNVKIESRWTPPFKYLEVLGMASCNIGTHFPHWLQTLENLVVLDLSNNQIRGSIPKDFFDNLSNLVALNLRSNRIVGSIPEFINFGLDVLDLSKNKLSGKIPNLQGVRLLNLASNQISGTIPSTFENSMSEWLNLSNNSLNGEPFQALKNAESLRALDLSGNRFSGKIPPWWARGNYRLQYLRLRQNLFSGDIPTSFCQLFHLKILDLAVNNFSGSIPSCIGHLSGMMINASIGPNYIAPAAPVASYLEPGGWKMQEFKQVWKGVEQDYTKNLVYLVNIDLSNNSLTGLIPDNLTSLSGLIGLNLSHNHLSGTIPSNIQRMKSLESIDFSNNKLSGPVPANMSIMDNLGFLNLSNNNLSGPIPENGHFLTFDEPSFAGNPYLCGKPLNNPCYGGDNVPTAIQEDNNGNHDKKEKILFYFVIALGFITGFWAFFGTLLLKKNWRHAYFHYMDEIADKMYVAIMVRVARLKN